MLKVKKYEIWQLIKKGTKSKKEEAKIGKRRNGVVRLKDKEVSRKEERIS